MSARIDLKNPRTSYAVMVMLLISAAGYFGYDYYWAPFADDQARLVAELDSKKSQLEKINLQRRRAAKLEQELADAEKEFLRLREMFPEEEKVPLRLQDLYAVVRSSGVQITRFHPEGRSEKDYYIENRYSLSINAGYHMLGYLFAEIANFNYPTTITDLRIGRYGGIEAELAKAAAHGWIPITTTVTFNLTTYTSRNLGK
jgi:type IV pilus assembly protein PilO